MPNVSSFLRRNWKSSWWIAAVTHTDCHFTILSTSARLNFYRWHDWTTSREKYFYWEYVTHDDVIKWKHFPRHWPFVRGIHRSPVNSPHKGQWRGALMFTLICARINSWVNNCEAGDLRRNRAHYDVIVMCSIAMPKSQTSLLIP